MADLDGFEGTKVPLPGAEPQIVKSTAHIQCYPKFHVNNEVKKFIVCKKKSENLVHGVGKGRRLKTTWNLTLITRF